MGQREFIAPAAYDDDLVEVEEDEPDYAAGERDVPAGGVDDQTAATVQLPDDPPAAALQPPVSLGDPVVPVGTPTTPTPAPSTDEPDDERGRRSGERQRASTGHALTSA